jgi:phosphomannomutase
MELFSTNDIRGKYSHHWNRDSAWALSGLRIDFDNWWFVLRAGSTEPRLRLVIEADTADLLEQRKAELSSLMSEEQERGKK